MDRSKWEYRPFEDCIEKSKKTKQLMTTDYQREGTYPIISQEASLISGYTNKSDYVNHFERPVVIFGDHTRVLKYVDFDFAVGADGVKILIPHRNLDAKFLLSFLTWYKIPNLGYSRHYKLLKEISIPVLPIPDQQRIVAELDCINEMIAVKQEQLKEFDNLAQSIFYEIFGDPVVNEKGWERHSLGEIAEFKNGLNFKPVKEGNAIKILGVSDFQDLKEIKTTESLSMKCIMETVDDDYYLKTGDIVIVRSNGSKKLVGRNVLISFEEKNVAYSGFCIRCRLTSNKCLPLFLNNVLSTPVMKELMTSGGRGCSIANINQQVLSRLMVSIPPLSLQHQFAEKIEAIEAMKANVRTSLKEVETLFNSRMDYYFN